MWKPGKCKKVTGERSTSTDKRIDRVYTLLGVQDDEDRRKVFRKRSQYAFLAILFLLLFMFLVHLLYVSVSLKPGVSM